ncbi:MAG TPA: hypothetical protein VGH53_15920 [Streptosporangiaceae bacterium]|jgi:hypothetical protein
MTIRKMIFFTALAVGALLVAGMRREIAHYLKIKQMSTGHGHPENAPAGGSQEYPPPEKVATDGKGTSTRPSGAGRR